MLLNLREYHRPFSPDREKGLAHALKLLLGSHVRTAVLAGGDSLLASNDTAIEAVVDLQALGLDQIGRASPTEALCIGAMVTRSRLAEDAQVRTILNGLIAEGARRWGGSLQRHRATAGGAVAVGAADDPLLVALLACDAVIHLYDHEGHREVLLSDFLPRRSELLAAPALIVEIMVPQPAAASGGAFAAVARTPRERPIVLTAATLTLSGEICADARLALGGVAATPVRLPQVEQALRGQTITPDLISAAAAQAADLVQPAGDHRGSPGYRRAMAAVLARRALMAASRSARSTHS